MSSKFTPPARRNAQIRTYWRLLQHGIKHNTVSDLVEARKTYSQLQFAHKRIRTNPRDGLADLPVSTIVESAHRLLGLSEKSLLKPAGGTER